MKLAKIRYLEGIKGNFGIVDGIDYRGTATPWHSTSQAIQSTVKSFVVL